MRSDNHGGIMRFFLIMLLALYCSYSTAQISDISAGDDFNLYFGIIVTCLLAVSEALALIPALKANSILQLLIGILKKLKPN